MLSIGRIKEISVQVTLNSDWTSGSGRTPLPVGTYEIAAPDGFHKASQTNFYEVDGEPVKNYKIQKDFIQKRRKNCDSLIDKQNKQWGVYQLVKN